MRVPQHYGSTVPVGCLVGSADFCAARLLDPDGHGSRRPSQQRACRCAPLHQSVHVCTPCLHSTPSDPQRSFTLPAGFPPSPGILSDAADLLLGPGQLLPPLGVASAKLLAAVASCVAVCQGSQASASRQVGGATVAGAAGAAVPTLWDAIGSAVRRRCLSTALQTSLEYGTQLLRTCGERQGGGARPQSAARVYPSGSCPCCVSMAPAQRSLLAAL